MFRSIEVCRIRGVAVRLHPSFALLAAVVVVLAIAGSRTIGDFLLNLIVPILLFVTVVWHEFGHVIAAGMMKVRVLDIVLTPLGGMARLYDLKGKPKEELVIALAGPMANLLIAVPVWLAFRTAESPKGIMDLLLFAPKRADLEDFVRCSFTFHAMLGVLNLAPFFPMDGGRVLRAALALFIGDLEATRFACRIGFVAALLLLFQPLLMPRNALWILPPVGIFLFWTGLVERFHAERDAMAKSGRVFFWTFGRGGAGRAAPDPFAPFESGPRPDALPPRDAGKVIDAPGKSRRIDE